MVVGETLGGSEGEFAKLMTRKARALGMTGTTYVNASGLPDEEQITTARDQAILGRAILDRFPGYYAYFSLPNYRYRGKDLHNHNGLASDIWTAWTASRPATRKPPDTIWLCRFTAARNTWSRWCSAEPPTPSATRACVNWS